MVSLSVKLQDQIDRMSALVEYAEHAREGISDWTVGQHIEHCCLTMRAAGSSIRKNADEPRRTKLTLVGRLIFRTGRIPRGRAKTPAAVRPQPNPSPEDLHRLLDKAKAAVAGLNAEDPNGVFEHPYFGLLDQKMSIAFLEIHNEHHLDIVVEILELHKSTGGT